MRDGLYVYGRLPSNIQHLSAKIKMELIIVRHGKTDSGIDPGLAKTGHEQAKVVAKRVASERVDAAYCSPMRRARETAAPYVERSNLPLIILDGLAEIDKNADQYISPALMKTDPELFKRFLTNPYDVCDISPEEFTADVTGAFAQIAQAHPGQTVAVFAHAIVINVYLADILEKGSHFFGMVPSNCSITRVKVSKAGRRSIESFNDTGHFLPLHSHNP
ncbi:MAG: broad specificity phosphatase PhoE [Cellvibrionaceae bacterium]|jgi:broad specificity phosphatase PhoE